MKHLNEKRVEFASDPLHTLEKAQKNKGEKKYWALTPVGDLSTTSCSTL